MTPIYASNRAKIAGWYVFSQPLGRYVVWDGGIGRSHYSTGVWCALTGNIVDVSDEVAESLPDCCVAGYLYGDEIEVIGFPHIYDISKTASTIPGLNIPYVYDAAPTWRAAFVDEIIEAEKLLEGSCCRLVSLEALPDNDALALKRFREMGPDLVARHPWSIWTFKRSAHFVANVPPERVETAVVREIVVAEQLELVDFVSVWGRLDILDKVIPLYPGDDDVNCPIWRKRNIITTYKIGDQIVGYE